MRHFASLYELAPTRRFRSALSSMVAVLRARTACQCASVAALPRGALPWDTALSAALAECPSCAVHVKSEFRQQRRCQHIHPQHRRHFKYARAAARHHDDLQFAEWEAMTRHLVNASTIPFIFLLMPQIMKNSLNMVSGNAAALGVLSWMGFLTSLMGNTMLLTYFSSKGERGAATVQAVGVTSNAILLSQIYAAGFIPQKVFLAMSVGTLLAAFLTLGHVTGYLGTTRAGKTLWSWWQSLLGILGLAILPQVLFATATGSHSWLPGFIAAAAGLLLLVLEQTGRLPEKLRGHWAALSAWTATMLFCFTPIGQLVNNFSNPSSLQGLSVTTVLMAMAGNALMVPRALLTNDIIWLTGSGWGSLLMGWAQLLSMWLGRTAAGSRYLGSVWFALASMAVTAFFSFTLVQDARWKQLPLPCGSLVALFTGARPPQPQEKQA